MKRLLFILTFQCFVFGSAHSQLFTVNDLITLTTMPSKNIDRFMGRNKFFHNNNKFYGTQMSGTFIEKPKSKKKDDITERSVDMYQKGDVSYYTLHTSSLTEYLDGQRRLIKGGFFYDHTIDVPKDSSMLFQKRNLSIQAISGMKDSVAEYTFVLQEKHMPNISDIRNAEDLLRFTSHELLVSFFGEKNVQKDLYYFSETELKKCSVLFGSSSHQVVFVWNDENNLTDLAYILVSNVMPTLSAAKDDGVFSNNEWRLQNGIYAGMSIKDLIKINENDFEIYGKPSELAFMVKPGKNGNVDFSKTAVMLSCKSCNTDRIFDKLTVRARDIAKENLPMFVFDIIIYAAHP